MFSHIHSLSESSKRSPDIYQDKSFNHGRLFNLSGSWGKKKTALVKEQLNAVPVGAVSQLKTPLVSIAVVVLVGI